MLRTPPRRDKPKEGKRVTQFAKRIELKELQSPHKAEPHTGRTQKRPAVVPVVRINLSFSVTIRGTQELRIVCSNRRHEQCG